MKIVQHTKYKKFFIGVIIAIVCIFLGYQIIHTINEKKEQERQQKITICLDTIESYYLKADFDGIEQAINNLDLLNYDTSNLKSILEYDRKVYPKAISYYKAIKDSVLCAKNGTYSSISNEYKKVKVAKEEFDRIEINEYSKIGQWILKVRNSSDYKAFKTVILDDYANTVVDDDFLDWIAADMLVTTLEPLTKYDFPIQIEK